MLRNANIYDIPRINELGSLLHDNFAKVYSINEMQFNSSFERNEDFENKFAIYATKFAAAALRGVIRR